MSSYLPPHVSLFLLYHEEVFLRNFLKGKIEVAKKSKKILILCEFNFSEEIYINFY